VITWIDSLLYKPTLGMLVGEDDYRKVIDAYASERARHVVTPGSVRLDRSYTSGRRRHSGPEGFSSFSVFVKKWVPLLARFYVGRKCVHRRRMWSENACSTSKDSQLAIPITTFT
jgi:hypothetical protein